MKRELFTAAGVALGLVFSCNGGQLDAFSERAPLSGAGGSGAVPTGGTTSGTTTGGSGGSSGTITAGGEGGDGPVDLLVIDDFEDGDRNALLNDGTWFISNDGTGVQTLAIEMPSVERAGSTYSLHTSGLGFETFGSVVCDIAGPAASFDASAYAALTFSARAEAGSSPDVLFAFLVGSLHFAVPVRLGTEWEPHTIAFADVLPAEDPNAVFDPRAIAAIQFVVPNDASFNFWLDDLSFVK